MNRKLKVRKFYEQEYFNFRQQHGWSKSIIDFKPENKIATGGYCPDEYDEVDFSEDEILFFEEQRSKKESPCALSINISQKLEVPEKLLKACDRIYWYLKHCFGELIVIKVSVDDINTFAICIKGYVDDGWDNGCELIEIWDDSGNLIGSVAPPCDDEVDEVLNWNDRPIKNTDFYCYPPEW